MDEMRVSRERKAKRSEDEDDAGTWASKEIDQLAFDLNEIGPSAESLVKFLHNWVLNLNKMSLEESERGKELRDIASSMWRWPVVAAASNRDEWAADKPKKEAKSALMVHLERIGVGKSTGRSGAGAKYSFGSKADPTTIATKIWMVLDKERRSKAATQHSWQKLARKLQLLQKDPFGRGEDVNKEWVKAADAWFRWKLGDEWPCHRLISGWRRHVYHYHDKGNDPSLKESTGDLRKTLLRSLQRSLSSIAAKKS